MEDRIRELAYLKWEAAGCPPGDGTKFWCEAEAEISTSGSSESCEASPPKAKTVSAAQPAKVAAKTSKGNR